MGKVLRGVTPDDAHNATHNDRAVVFALQFFCIAIFLGIAMFFCIAGKLRFLEA